MNHALLFAFPDFFYHGWTEFARIDITPAVTYTKCVCYLFGKNQKTRVGALLRNFRFIYRYNKTWWCVRCIIDDRVTHNIQQDPFFFCNFARKSISRDEGRSICFKNIEGYFLIIFSPWRLKCNLMGKSTQGMLIERVKRLSFIEINYFITRSVIKKTT